MRRASDRRSHAPHDLGRLGQVRACCQEPPLVAARNCGAHWLIDLIGVRSRHLVAARNRLVISLNHIGTYDRMADEKPAFRAFNRLPKSGFFFVLGSVPLVESSAGRVQSRVTRRTH